MTLILKVDGVGELHVEAADLTPARRRGLEALASAADQKARYSNRTRLRDAVYGPTVYWQIADWLIKHKLATDDLGLSGPFETLSLTPHGVELCHELDIAVATREEPPGVSAVGHTIDDDWVDPHPDDVDPGAAYADWEQR